MLAGVALLFQLAGGPLSPSLTADFAGDGREETITAAPRRGAVRLEVRDKAGRRLADASAPAPAADVVQVELSAGSLGSAGALLAVNASTDASQCVSVWRFRGGALARLPVRGAGGKELPDCGPPGAWTYGWEKESEGTPSALVRERTAKNEQGVHRIREVFAFAGFSLDADARRSASEIDGVPIPAWYDAELYSAPALETLYARFDYARMRPEPTLRIVADRERGFFALRFTGPKGTVEAPVDSLASARGETTLGARLAGRTARVTVRLAGDGAIPVEAEVQGLGAPLDQMYGPAGSWHGQAHEVFPDAADEVAKRELSGSWVDPKGGPVEIVLAGAPPYRLRIGGDLYEPDLARAQPPVDLVLLPTGSSGRPWGVVLRGPNSLDRIPFVCAPAEASGGGACRADGPPQRLRRLGARVNVP